jgi:hypothetical protein
VIVNKLALLESPSVTEGWRRSIQENISLTDDYEEEEEDLLSEDTLGAGGGSIDREYLQMVVMPPTLSQKRPPKRSVRFTRVPPPPHLTDRNAAQ